MRDRHALALLHLKDGLIIGDEETALGNMGFKGWKRGRGRLRVFYGLCTFRLFCARKHPFWQPAYRALELHGKVALGKEAVAGLTGIETILTAKRTKHHLGVSQEIPVDWD